MFARVGSGTLLVVLAFGILSAAWWGLDGLFGDAGRANDLAGILQAVVTAAAVLVGGVYAAYKLQVFRDFAPHLTVSHSISHRPVGESYTHIAVTVSLHNGSKVKVSVRDGFFRVQQVAPMSDQEIERLYAQVFADKLEVDFQWPTLDEIRRTWSNSGGIIEPGERHLEACEFVVPRDVEAVVIYTYFHNPEYVEGFQTPEGWGATTVYNICQQ